MGPEHLKVLVLFFTEGLVFLFLLRVTTTLTEKVSDKSELVTLLFPIPPSKATSKGTWGNVSLNALKQRRKWKATTSSAGVQGV